MPPFLEFPLQRTPLWSSASTGIWPCCSAVSWEAFNWLGGACCRRHAAWPVLSSPAANEGWCECYVRPPTCQGGCFAFLKKLPTSPALCLSSLTPCHWSWLSRLSCVGDFWCLMCGLPLPGSIGESKRESSRRVQNWGWVRRNQSPFQWVNSSHEVAKVLEFQLYIIPSKEIPGWISFRMDWLDLLAVQGTLKLEVKLEVYYYTSR